MNDPNSDGVFYPLRQHESYSLKRYEKAQSALSASNFRIGYRFLNDRARKDLETLYVFCRVVDDLVDEPYPGEDPRDELNAWESDLSGIRRFDHPLSDRVRDLLDRRGIPPDLLLDIVRGMSLDVDRVRIASMDELKRYCYLAAGAVGRACIPIFGGDLDRLSPYADALGEAFQLTNILRDVREDAQRDRIYLPSDRMAEFGVTEEDVLSGRLTAGFRGLLQELWSVVDDQYLQAESLLSDRLDCRIMRPARAMEAYYREIHREIGRRNFDVLTERIGLSAFRKAALLVYFIAVGQWTGPGKGRGGSRISPGNVQ